MLRTYSLYIINAWNFIQILQYTALVSRIENWRNERKAETLEKEAEEEDPNRKGWTLEDDEEDDAEDV